LKKYIRAVLFTVAVCFVLNIASAGFAVDKEGCLTCHRYPGLVRLEKTDEFKVLHIDEEKHLDSPHGKVDCRECHTQVVEIPHTGQTKVECTTNCHSDDKEKITAMDSSALSAYHQDEKFAITRMEDKSSCRVCHPLYPHSKNNKVRALVNMHTGFMVCEVCHLKKENIENLTYDWQDPEPFEFVGEPYGTHAKSETEETPGSESLISRMLNIFSSKDDSGETPKTSYLISRIAVFSEEKGEKSILINTADNEKASLFKERGTTPDSGESKKELEYFHRDTARKEISVVCNECHSPDGILDFKKLGFNEKKTKDLQFLNIKSMLTKYETFIIPNLFGH
jgi:hypothetical protein